MVPVRSILAFIVIVSLFTFSGVRLSLKIDSCSFQNRKWRALNLSCFIDTLSCNLDSYLDQTGRQIRIANSLYCEKKRKRSEFASHRFASLRRKSKKVRFRFASLFGRPNSQNCEKIRRILAKKFPICTLRE